MKILLTQFQQQQLEPLRAKVRAAADSDKPGMAIAQLYIVDGEMVCGFVSNERALEIQATFSQDLVGRISSNADDRQCATLGDTPLQDGKE